MDFFNQTADADIEEDLPRLSIPMDKSRYNEANQLHEQIISAENSLFTTRNEIDSTTSWQPVRSVTAEAKRAILTISNKNGYDEFQADPNVASGAEYFLTFPTDLKNVTALRIELLPLDIETAAHTPECGGVIQKILLDVIDASGKATSVALHEVIADEEH